MKNGSTQEKIDSAQLATSYFAAWQEHDFDALQKLLADDCSFAGPMGKADGAEECRRGLEGLSKIVTGLDIKKVLADGPDVMTWFEMHSKDAPPVPVVDWMRIENGRIKRIRVTFDPRPLLKK